MKKHIVSIILLVLCMTLLAGCGRSPNEPQPEPEPELTDIKGTWLALDYDSEDYLLGAKIDGEYIGLFEFYKEDPSFMSVVFMGTVENGGAVAEGGSWISKPVSNMGLLSDEEHTFTLKDGQLVIDIGVKEYEIDHSEETVFSQGEWDDSKIPWASWGANASLIKELEIKDTGWAISNGRLYYYMTIYNPNNDIMVDRPRFKVEAKDASGNVMDYTLPELHHVNPGEEIVTAGIIAMSDDAPNSVTFEKDSFMERYLHTGEYVPVAPLQIKDISYGNYDVRGKIVNTEGGEVRHYTVVAFMYDANGKVIDVDTIGGDVAANGESGFTLTLHSQDTSSAKVFVTETVW